MHSVKILGWRKGAQKISFIMLLKEKGGIRLSEAKSIKDRIIDNSEQVEIIVNDEITAKAIIQEANAIGFIAEINKENSM